MSTELTIEDFRRASEDLAPYIRRTPTVTAGPLCEVIDHLDATHWKLECLQVTGAFKARGALLSALRLSPEARARGLVTASGGNHGLGVAFAGRTLRVPVRVVLPENAPAEKEQALRVWGADVIRHGAVWDDAQAHALSLAATQGWTEIHPFARRDVLLGQGTIALEMLEDVPHADCLVIPIGGGGLIGGVATAAKLLRPELRVVGVEPTGAPTLRRAVDAGAVVVLDAVDTAANTLAPRATHGMNLALVERHVDDIVLVSDEEMRGAARWLWAELGVAAELSGAAATAAIAAGRVGGEQPIAIVCGKGTAGTAI